MFISRLLLRPAHCLFSFLNPWRRCHRLVRCRGTVESFIFIGGRRKPHFSICPLFDRGRQLGLSGGVSCSILTQIGQTAPRGAAPALPPGGCEVPIHLATPRRQLGKAPNLAVVSVPRGYTGVASQMSCRRLPNLGGALVLTLCATGRAFGCWALHLTYLTIRRRGKLTEHTKELSYWETDPEGKLEKRLLLMIVDEFASVRTD